ncbi:MAG: nuclear transport factor 2 family protein [Burkholderiaceae bacterium]
MSPQDQDLQNLRELNKRFIHNFVTNNVPSHDAIIHPRFMCISSKGARQNRADYLHEWATGFDPEVIIYWDMRDEDIALYGNVALVRATNKWVRVIHDQEVTGMTSYTDTYVREGTRWLCIEAQLTGVAPEHYPSDSTIVVQYIKGALQP